MSLKNNFGDSSDSSNAIVRRGFGAALAIVLLIVFIYFVGSLVETVPPTKILLVQTPIYGTLNWYSEPGMIFQKGGDLTWFDKMFSVEYSKDIMFNDKGVGTISGVFQVEMPLNPDTLTALHSKYKTKADIEANLIQPVLKNVMLFTGPTMSSWESTAEKRNDLMRYIIDQLENGIYRTRVITKKVEDPLNPKEHKEISLAEIVLDESGKPMRQGPSPLSEFGLKVVNFSISDIKYDAVVQTQIAKQQEITMRVQTSKAEVLEAQQRKLASEAEGQTKVTTAEYERRVIKIQAETDAERDYQVAMTNAKRDREVAEQKKMAAVFYKQEQILIGEGDAAKKKLILEADGALEQKIKAIVEINGRYAAAFGQHRLVPDIVMGAGDGKTGNASQVTEFMGMLNANVAKQLSLDLTVKK